MIRYFCIFPYILTPRIIQYLVAKYKQSICLINSFNIRFFFLFSCLWFNPLFTVSSCTFSNKVSDGMQVVHFTKDTIYSFRSTDGFWVHMFIWYQLKKIKKEPVYHYLLMLNSTINATKQWEKEKQSESKNLKLVG